MAETNLIFPIAAILLIGVLFSGSGSSSSNDDKYQLKRTMEVYSPPRYKETSTFQYYKEPDIDVFTVYEKVSKSFRENPDAGRTYLGVTDQIVSKVHTAYGELVEAMGAYRFRQTPETETQVMKSYDDIQFFTLGRYHSGSLLSQLVAYAEDILQRLSYIKNKENFRFPRSSRYLDENEMIWLSQQFSERIKEMNGIIERCALLESQVKTEIDAKKTYHPLLD